MTGTHCIEVATFKLKPGTAPEALLGVEKKIRSGAIRGEPGYRSRELAFDEAKGEWLLIMRFETRPQMDAWMAKVKTVPEMREMGALLDASTMAVRFFEGVE